MYPLALLSSSRMRGSISLLAADLIKHCSNVEMDLRLRGDDGGLVFCMVACWGRAIDFFVLIILFVKI